jgi:hypothetical protein
MSNEEIVKEHFPDALCGHGIMNPDQFFIQSEGWWPGAVGHGWTKAAAWKDAAETVQKWFARRQQTK